MVTVPLTLARTRLPRALYGTTAAARAGDCIEDQLNGLLRSLRTLRGMVRLRKSLFTALLVAVVAVSAPTQAQAEAIPGNSDQPWAVSLHLERGDDAFCSGTLIGPLVVVTAAHCLDESTDRALLVRSIGFDGIAVWRSVAVSRQHPRYRAGNISNARRTDVVHDIAVLRLQKAVRLETYPKLAETKAQGNLVFYGFSSYRTYVYQEVSVLTHRAKEWFNHVNARIHIVAGVVTGGSVYASCAGDSGGGLVSWGTQGPVLVGVVSYGTVRCRDNGPSVFTRISAHRKWVAAQQRV